MLHVSIDEELSSGFDALLAADAYTTATVGNSGNSRACARRRVHAVAQTVTMTVRSGAQTSSPSLLPLQQQQQQHVRTPRQCICLLVMDVWQAQLLLTQQQKHEQQQQQQQQQHRQGDALHATRSCCNSNCCRGGVLYDYLDAVCDALVDDDEVAASLSSPVHVTLHVLVVPGAARGSDDEGSSSSDGGGAATAATPRHTHRSRTQRALTQLSREKALLLDVVFVSWLRRRLECSCSNARTTAADDAATGNTRGAVRVSSGMCVTLSSVAEALTHAYACAATLLRRHARRVRATTAAAAATTTTAAPSSSSSLLYDGCEDSNSLACWPAYGCAPHATDNGEDSNSASMPAGDAASRYNNNNTMSNTDDVDNNNDDDDDDDGADDALLRLRPDAQRKCDPSDFHALYVSVLGEVAAYTALQTMATVAAFPTLCALLEHIDRHQLAVQHASRDEDVQQQQHGAAAAVHGDSSRHRAAAHAVYRVNYGDTRMRNTVNADLIDALTRDYRSAHNEHEAACELTDETATAAAEAAAAAIAADVAAPVIVDKDDVATTTAATSASPPQQTTATTAAATVVIDGDAADTAHAAVSDDASGAAGTATTTTAAAVARAEAADAAAEDTLCPTQQQHLAEARTQEALQACKCRVLRVAGGGAGALRVCVCRITPLCAHAQRCRVDEYVPLLLGLVQCFFGNYYVALIAVAETARLLAWAELARSYATLRANYTVAVEQNRKDNARDDDGNGVPDVREMPASALASRKLRLFVKSVDVDALEAAVRTLLACCVTVMATLRVRLARTIAIAHSLASLAKELMPLDTLLRDALPPDLRKLAGLLTKVIFYLAALVLSSFMGYVVFMLHCALRGAHIVVSHAIHIAQLHGSVGPEASVHTPGGRTAMAVLALCGFVWQVLYHDCLPFPLSVVLFPFTLAEYLLQVFIYVFLYATPLR